MKILQIHNYYLLPGGEDTAFRSEAALLRERGHEVSEYVESSENIKSRFPLSVALQSIWSEETRRRLDECLRREHPDIVHFHNTFPLISPSAYSACRARSIPVVQSLDNPRLLCPSANFYRAGRLCEDCLGKTPPLPAVCHHCYHDSMLQTGVVAAMLTFHRLRQTWNTEVDAFLVATDFYRRKFIQGGLPAEKIIVKPHFLHPDPGVRPGNRPGDYALFVGRLDPEKGVRTLLAAWERLPQIPLKIRGEGKMLSDVHRWIQTSGRSNVEVVRRLSRHELIRLMQNARMLIWPSEGYYETFGYVAMESFSCGVPVLTSRIGVQAETVTDGVTGLHFQPGDAADLARKAAWAWDRPEMTRQMGRAAREEFLNKYTSERNYPLLMAVYSQFIHPVSRKGAGCIHG
jgi:glycosyltransferase involved in cell wall biosynthesis